MREITIGAAQMGPIQKADSREAVVARMIALLDQAVAAGCDLVVFPELCLTTFFPRWLMEDQAEVDAWFEREMPNPATAPLFARAAAAGVAISFGFAELTAEGRRFNTQILTDRAADIIGRYRKVHLPGHAEYEPERRHQHLEKRYFEPGDLGFPVWRNLDAWMGMLVCNDRRWPEAYLPKIYDPSRVDRIIDVGQDEAEDMTRALGAQEGIFAGISSGGAIAAALRLSAELEHAVIVVIICDRGDRYLSTNVFPA